MRIGVAKFECCGTFEGRGTLRSFTTSIHVAVYKHKEVTAKGRAHTTLDLATTDATQASAAALCPENRFVNNPEVMPDIHSSQCFRARKIADRVNLCLLQVQIRFKMFFHFFPAR